ncbi:MAG: efflux RND transporter periplasmic adaptor subunit [Bacteroidota bacterium]
MSFSTARLGRLLLAALCIVTFGCSSDQAASPGGGGWGGRGGGGGTPSVEVIQARFGALPLQERVTGTVVAENQVMIFPEISAVVTRVDAQNGDYVQRGTPLVYLRDVQAREQLRQDEAALTIAEADARRAEATKRELESRLERTKQLADREFQSQEELETLQAQVDVAAAGYEQALARIEQAKATIDERKEQVRQTVVRAPISGRVGMRDVEVGMRVDPNTQLYALGNFDEVRVEVAIPDDKINVIETGMPVIVSSETFAFDPIEATLSRISPFLEIGSYSAGAEVDLDNSEMRLRPGMFVNVDILYGETQQATLIPTSALYEDPNTGLRGIYVAGSLGTETPLEEPETFDPNDPPALTEATPMTFRQVDVLAEGRGMVGVSGLQAGDWVVTVGQNLLGTPGQESTDARARPVTWQRIAELQNMQEQDLLRQFMEKQQRMARERFSSPTSDASDAEATLTQTPTSAAPVAPAKAGA